MANKQRDNRSYRGFLQSDDGVIHRVLDANHRSITFETEFGLSKNMIDRLKAQSEHIVFSERSRIARLGIQITCDPPSLENLKGNTLSMVQVAAPVIPGFPGLDELHEFFNIGLPVGRLVFCSPEALLTSDEVIRAIERSELKLPASTAISSDGSIVISPHRVVCELKEKISKETFGRILLGEDGRELLNRYQVRKPVKALIVPPGEGIITTCSMYLNDHYVVLQSGYELGSNLPATVLDPIKTRGIQIYLEIVNGTTHPIVNPLISAKVYGPPKSTARERRTKQTWTNIGSFSYGEMETLKKRLEKRNPSKCHFLDKPVAVIQEKKPSLENARILMNGPDALCSVSKAECRTARRDFSSKSNCSHRYATSAIGEITDIDPVILVLKYFPNIMEHRDIINMACEGRISSMYFYEPSCEHGPFLSQEDHSRLQEYHAFGIDVYWVCGLNHRMMIHTLRDGKGFFVVPDCLAAFHKSMLFAFYGSTLELSKSGIQRLGELMDALTEFWGGNIGIVTGGGSGVMELANTLAKERGMLSGANFLEITDQSMTTDVDFCQVFQSTCRHSRQKWFEVTSFPIFNVGGLGSLEELGITLCNMKLSIMERVPIILFDTEGNKGFWDGMKRQISTMVENGRAPYWIEDQIVITDDPKVVIDVYRKQLQLF